MKNDALAKVLPTEAAVQLRRAARTPVTKEDPRARIKAIDNAIQKIKRQHPTFFKGVTL